MDPKRKVSLSEMGLLANKQRQQFAIDVNTPEAFHVEPTSVIVDADPNKTQPLRETFKLSFISNKVVSKTTSTARNFDFTNAFNQFIAIRNANNKDAVGCAKMTQPTVKFPADPTPAILICAIEKRLRESSQKFEKGTNKENCVGCTAIGFYTPYSKYSSAEKLPADLPPSLLDYVLTMEEEYKSRQQETLPDDLKGVTVDPNCFTDFLGLNVNDIMGLYGVVIPDT